MRYALGNRFIEFPCLGVPEKSKIKDWCQCRKNDFAVIICCQQWLHHLVPFFIDWILPATKSMLFGRGDRMDEQLFTMAEDGDTDIIVSHALGEFGPQLIVVRFVFGVTAGA